MGKIVQYTIFKIYITLYPAGCTIVFYKKQKPYKLNQVKAEKLKSMHTKYYYFKCYLILCILFFYPLRSIHK